MVDYALVKGLRAILRSRCHRISAFSYLLTHLDPPISLRYETGT